MSFGDGVEVEVSDPAAFDADKFRATLADSGFTISGTTSKSPPVE